MKYRPTAKTSRGKLHNHYVDCPEIEKERDITICMRCPYKVKLTFNTIHCDYKGKVIKNQEPTRRVRPPKNKQKFVDK